MSELWTVVPPDGDELSVGRVAKPAKDIVITGSLQDPSGNTATPAQIVAGLTQAIRTAISAGTAGVGLVLAKVGTELQLKNLAAEDSSIIITEDVDGNILIKSSVGGSGAVLIYQGDIVAAANFPTPAAVQAGWVYRIMADVTDDDPTKTNTGLSFAAGDEIFWVGSTWASSSLPLPANMVVANSILGNDEIPVGNGSRGLSTGGLTGTAVSAHLSATGNPHGAKASDIPNDSSVDGVTIADALNRLAAAGSWQQKIRADVESLCGVVATDFLTTSGSNDLQLAINTLDDGDVLEIQTSDTYGPIVLPTNKKLTIMAGAGYMPKITGQYGITLVNGCRDILIAGLILQNCTTADVNAKGAAICLAHQAIVTDITFYDCAIKLVATGSAVMLSYHQSIGGDNYATASTLAQMSERVAFIGCAFARGGTDGNEGANLAVRGIKQFMVENCQIDANNTTRGIQVQNCIDAWIANNTIINCREVAIGNGEAIKFDSIGTPSGYRISGAVIGNKIRNAVEGIDIDDVTSMTAIYDNIISDCRDEGISLDGGSSPSNGFANIVGNVCFRCDNGIRLESGSTAELTRNVCFNNTSNNYFIENGYSVDATNSQSSSDAPQAGDEFGPMSATSDNFVAFSGTTGRVTKDSGYNAASFLLPNITELLVVSIDGNDTTGNGTFQKPYRTIQKAFDIYEAIITTGNWYKMRTVLVTPGIYVENVTIPPGRFTISSTNCIIQGDVTIRRSGALQDASIDPLSGVHTDRMRHTVRFEGGAGQESSNYDGGIMIYGNLICSKIGDDSFNTLELYGRNMVISGIFTPNDSTTNPTLMSGGISAYFHSSRFNNIHSPISSAITMSAWDCRISGSIMSHPLGTATYGKISFDSWRDTAIATVALTNGEVGVYSSGDRQALCNVRFNAGTGFASSTAITLKVDSCTYTDLKALGLTMTNITFTLIDQAQGIGYTPLNAAHWSGSPTNEKDAIDRIASAVYALRGNVAIP